MTKTNGSWFRRTQALVVAPGPVRFSHYIDHYLMAPWIAEADRLIRAFMTPAAIPVVTTSLNAGSVELPDIRLEVESQQPLTDEVTDWVAAKLTDALGLADDVTEFYDHVVPGDPVLAAAADYGLRGARLKISPGVFEAVVTAVASQNVHFTRTFQVMDRLVRALGRQVPCTGGIAYTFPESDIIAAAGEATLRACGFGYRSRFLLALARRIVDDGIDLDALRDESDTQVVRSALIGLPGVGPFTADLVLSIGFRRPAFHLDSFTRAILTGLYSVRADDDAALADFVDAQFGDWKHYAMLLLTTDTDIWASSLGVDLPVKSYARYRLSDNATERGTRHPTA